MSHAVSAKSGQQPGGGVVAVVAGKALPWALYLSPVGVDALDTCTAISEFSLLLIPILCYN